MINSGISSDLDYLVGYSLVMAPDVVVACVLCAFGLLILDPYFDWSEKNLARFSRASACLFLVAVVLVPWITFFIIALYFACHALLVVLLFIPTFLEAAGGTRSAPPFFPLDRYSKYTLYLIERKSELTLGSPWDTLLKGLTPSGTALLFGGRDMRFSTAVFRIERFCGIMESDRFAGAVIKTVVALVSLFATLGSAWGFFLLLQKVGRHWSDSRHIKK